MSEPSLRTSNSIRLQYHTIYQKTGSDNIMPKTEKLRTQTEHYCDVCDFMCTSLLVLHQHQGIVHGNYRYPCELCKFSCHSKADMRKHRLEEHNLAAFSCDVCEYRCSEMSNLRKHSKIHEEKVVREKLKCDVCDAEYVSSKGLRQHKQKIHGVPKSDRKRHQNSTATKLPITCDQCGKIFIKREGWRTHYLRLHIGIKNPDLPQHLQRVFQCPKCDYRAGAVWMLETHMRIHTRKKRYQCNYCEKRFSSNEAHRKHYKTHTGNLKSDK